MRYRRYASHQSSQPRTITVRFDGKCHCCGATIKAGEIADYYPSLKAIGHIGGLEGNSPRCTSEIRQRREFIDVDRMYEDQCSEICGR